MEDRKYFDSVTSEFENETSGLGVSASVEEFSWTDFWLWDDYFDAHELHVQSVLNGGAK